MDALTVSPTEQHNLDTMAAVVPYWNRHDVAGILSHYDDEITWHDMAMGRTHRGKAVPTAGRQRSGRFSESSSTPCPTSGWT
jgi:hypothetical protein